MIEKILGVFLAIFCLIFVIGFAAWTFALIKQTYGPEQRWVCRTTVSEYRCQWEPVAK